MNNSSALRMEIAWRARALYAARIVDAIVTTVDYMLLIEIRGIQRLGNSRTEQIFEVSPRLCASNVRSVSGSGR